MLKLNNYLKPIALNNKSELIAQLKKKGFCKVKLPDNKMHEFLLSLATNKVKNLIKNKYPEVNMEHFKAETYHVFCEANQIEHSKLFCKLSRYFPWQTIENIFKQYIHKEFVNIFKELVWVQEPNPEAPPHSHCYFRLVRPLQITDAPHAHCDVWGHESIGLETPTIKFWMPLMNCGKGASFKAMPASHLRDYNYDPIIKKTAQSPFNIPKLIAGQPYSLEEIITEPPCIFVLHRKLLHGEMINNNPHTTRWSCEATAIVKHPDFHWL